MSDKISIIYCDTFISLFNICQTAVRYMSVRISIRLSDKMYDNIQKVSDDLSDSLSDTCRTAIEYYINQYEQKKSNKKQLKIDKTLNYNYINQLNDEITYLKNENIILREQIDMKIINLQFQFEMLLTNFEINRKTSKSKDKKEQSKYDKDLFISRM